MEQSTSCGLTNPSPIIRHNSNAGQAQQQTEIWLRDDIQFPRLLAEITATQDIDIALLAESMDLSFDEVVELFDRAEAAWEASKAALCPVRTPAPAMISAKSISVRYNGSKKSITTLAIVTVAGQEFDLRICGRGKEAYFEWINEAGDIVGQPFFEIEGIEQAKDQFVAKAGQSESFLEQDKLNHPENAGEVEVMTRMGSSDDMAENTWAEDGAAQSFASFEAANEAVLDFLTDAVANGLSYEPTDYFLRNRVTKETQEIILPSYS